MRHSYSFGACLCALIGLFSTTSVAQQGVPSAGNEKFIIEALPDRLARRVESRRKMLLQFGLADPDKTPRGVVNGLKIWTADYPLIRVCFFSGSRQARTRIAKVAMEWKNAVSGLPLDFGDLANPRLCNPGEVNHIRVAFGPDGYWSLVGTDSIVLADQKEASMNLEGFDTAPPRDSVFRRTVLHEFGHAIGFEHEHQNPQSSCPDDFDWPKIERYLAGPPNNWSKEEVQFNMGVLNRPGLLATAFDSSSIMIYTFPARFYKARRGRDCYSRATLTALSSRDKALAADIYPSNPKDRLKVVARIWDHHLGLIKASGMAEGAKSAVLQMIKEYLPDRARAEPQQK